MIKRKMNLLIITTMGKEIRWIVIPARRIGLIFSHSQGKQHTLLRLPMPKRLRAGGPGLRRVKRLNNKEYVRLIMDWYQANHRKLPWRSTRDPYKVWLSEVILQQTRVEQGLPYYLRFIEAFPSVRELARARGQTVLRLWQGLGYYSRARNLHRCAKMIAGELDGRFPTTFDGLRRLPGIGPYTAAAIASIAFDRSTAVVDGNVFRVLSRLYGMEDDISSPEGKRIFQSKANALMPGDHPGDFNQALMEFGATHCTPKKPKCDTCLFSNSCVAFRKDLVAFLPVKGKRTKIRARYLYYFIFIGNGSIGMKKRTGADIWKGLYDFYLVESTTPMKLKEVMASDNLLKKLGVPAVEEAGTVRHLLTHRILYIHFFLVPLSKKNLTKFCSLLKPIQLFSPSQVAKLPKPRPIVRFLESKGLLSRAGNR